MRSGTSRDEAARAAAVARIDQAFAGQDFASTPHIREALRCPPYFHASRALAFALKEDDCEEEAPLAAPPGSVYPIF